MKDITENLGRYFVPVKALIIYNENDSNTGAYVEAYDIGSEGQPINRHPLSIKECNELADALNTAEGVSAAFLRPEALLPANVCYINPERNGFAIWQTPTMERTLHFIDKLDMPSGKCYVPPMIWMAGREYLTVYAWNGKEPVTEETRLYKAPFFNIYSTGRVCMGTVKMNNNHSQGLENFMATWMNYFFNSYFSHLLDENPVKVNMVQLWKSLCDSGKPFPMEVLKEKNLQLKDLIL